MVSSKTSVAFVIEHLKAERCIFNENAYELLKRQEKAFELCCDFIGRKNQLKTCQLACSPFSLFFEE
jgi:hypothetical protein